MNFEMRDCKPSLTETEVERVEQKWGFVFPVEYRRFLLMYNGGRPNLECFRFKGGSYGDSMIDWFLAIYDGKYNNFERCYNVFKVKEKRLLDNLVPIARDPGGNLICISVSSEDRGAIYFWDHEKEQDEATSKNVSLIADNFDEFISKLEPNEFA